MALGKNSILAGALAAAVGIPVWMENSETSTEDQAAQQTSQADFSNQQQLTGQISFLPVNDYREIFNFELGPQAIRSRWARVSTIPADDNLTALRVPLVTGTQEWDLQGSLTYFVDQDQRVRRILFRGFTGDPSALVYFAKDHLGFSATKSNSSELYVKTQMFQSIGLLRLDQQNAINSNHPGHKIAVVFEINDPRTTLRLSPQSAVLMEQGITTVSRQ